MMSRMPQAEEPLEGGNLNPEVVRVADRVHRHAGEWTPAVHQLLQHLANRRYRAPLPLGMDDQGREVLSFVPGECVYPDSMLLVATDTGLRRIGRLVADYHQAQEDFVPPADARWRSEGRDPSGSTEVIAHNDLAPWNLIAGPTDWVFIDWDMAAPGRRFWDLSWALHTFVGLWPESELDDSTIAAHIDAFCDGAEVDLGERPALLDVVVERTRDHAEMLRRRAADGDRRFAALVEDGHAERWEQGAQHVEAHRERWCSHLRS